MTKYIPHELRQAVVDALAVTERCYMGAQSLEDMADAAIAAYEAHRPRAAVTLTREEWEATVALERIDEHNRKAATAALERFAELNAGASQ